MTQLWDKKGTKRNYIFHHKSINRPKRMGCPLKWSIATSAWPFLVKSSKNDYIFAYTTRIYKKNEAFVTNHPNIYVGLLCRNQLTFISCAQPAASLVGWIASDAICRNWWMDWIKSHLWQSCYSSNSYSWLLASIYNTKCDVCILSMLTGFHLYRMCCCS